MRRHVLKLDALRGLAAQPVVLSHSAALVYPPSPAMTVVGWAAHLAVIFFFVLSGYAIIGGLREELRRNGAIDLRDFAIRRVARIYPPYLLTIALVALYFSLLDRSTTLHDTSAAAVIRSLAFAFFSTDAITLTPVWSLRIEVLLYAIAGFGFFAAGQKGYAKYLAFAIAATLSTLLCWRLSFGVTGLFAFALGGVLYTILRNYPAREEADIWRTVAPLGGWSYTLYLIHMPIVLLTIECLRPLLLGAAFLVFASIISANIAAALLSKLVERPKEIAGWLRSCLKVIDPARAKNSPAGL